MQYGSLRRLVQILALISQSASCSVVSDSLWSHDCILPGSSVQWILQARYWSGLPFPSPEDLPDPGIELRSPTLKGDSLPNVWNVEVSLNLCSGWRPHILKLMIEICVIKEQKIYFGWLVYYCCIESRNCFLLAMNLCIYLRTFASKVLKV